MFETLFRPVLPLSASDLHPEWHRVRRPELPRDQAVTGTTRHWLQSLPPDGQ